MNPILAGLTMGLLGSVHCLGMCGPLMLALPATGGNSLRHFAGRCACQLGRVTTYAALGVVMGTFGRSFALAGWQRGLSMAFGVVILIAVVARGAHWTARAQQPIVSALAALRRAFGPLLQRRTIPAMYGLGVLNGLLPCGLVYVALAGAAATGNPADGARFMIAFGAGTVPAMLTASLAGRLVPLPLRLKLQRMVPGALLVLAALFILRGLSLGIPYVSPDLSAMETGGQPACCQH